MRQVQDETLRLSTLAPWAARYADKDVRVCGYSIPARTPVIMALGVALKNTQQWKEEEKLVHLSFVCSVTVREVWLLLLLLLLLCRWDPDRFSTEGPHGKRGNEFCPFGVHSRRKCPGYLFSYFEVTVFVAILLQRCVGRPNNLDVFGNTTCSRFEVVPVEKQEVTKVYGLVTEPEKDIFVYLRQRDQS